MRSIPDNNLAYPVLIQIPFWKQSKFWSGFLLRFEDKVFLVTAKHVLVDIQKNKLWWPTATVTCQTHDPNDDTMHIFDIDFSKIASTFTIEHDIGVIPFAKVQDGKMFFLPWIKQKVHGVSSIVCVDNTWCLAFDQVLVSNEVYIMGYPISIWLKQAPQFDYNKPLLKKWIVASKNKKNKTIILDCMVFWGNSGWPVIQVSHIWKETQFKVIWIVIQYIPYVQKKEDVLLGNSGYSLAVSIETIFDIVKKISF